MTMLADILLAAASGVPLWRGVAVVVLIGLVLGILFFAESQR